MAVSAKVIADSKFGSTRLITLEIELHRFILPELNTHRALSRNFQSSRAVPVEKMIEQVRNNPAMPVHFGKNQPGMVAGAEGDVFTGIQLWDNAAQMAADFAEKMHNNGFHKQIVNRLLEPYMWTRGVVTATYDDWQAFKALRLHFAAQPEIKALAVEIDKDIEESSPVQLKEGDWHVPYYGEGVWRDSNYVNGEMKSLYNKRDKYSTLENAVKVSASCCAQVSYRKLDDSLEKAERVYDMLNLPENGVYPDNPPHFSPTEHIARATELDSTYIGHRELSGNFHSRDFIQYRKLLEIGAEGEYIK